MVDAIACFRKLHNSTLSLYNIILILNQIYIVKLLYDHWLLIVSRLSPWNRSP